MGALGTVSTAELTQRGSCQGWQLGCSLWSKAMGCPWTPSILEAAAEGGHIPVLQHLLDKKCPFDGKAPLAAASKCHRDVLQFLLENKCPFDFRTCAATAQTGHLALLQWVREVAHCNWNASTCASVSSWSQAFGCPPVGKK